MNEYSMSNKRNIHFFAALSLARVYDNGVRALASKLTLLFDRKELKK